MSRALAVLALLVLPFLAAAQQPQAVVGVEQHRGHLILKVWRAGR